MNKYKQQYNKQEIILKISEKINNLDNLNRTEKEVLSQIQYLDNKKGCEAKNQYLSDKLGICVRQIQRIIKRLKDLGYITYELVKNSIRILRGVSSVIGTKIKKVVEKGKKKGGDILSSLYNNHTKKYIKGSKDLKKTIITVCQLDGESDYEFDFRVSERERLYGDTTIYKKEYTKSNKSIPKEYKKFSM
jgi:DNA-binding Lrp family transcriptional regulator